MMTLATTELTEEELAFYDENGYVGPFTICSPQEMADIRAYIDEQVLCCPGPAKRNEQCRHLDHRTVYDICSHPAIVDRVCSLLGPDVVLWRSHFFTKPAGGNAVPWHQDGTYWPLEPKVNVTAWVAIDPATTENSCVHVIPGSHREYFPDSQFATAEERSKYVLTHQTHLEYVDENKAVPIELKAGEFFLFNERALHSSPPNRSAHRRLGLAVRMTQPDVRVKQDELFPAHRCLMLAGYDRHQLSAFGEAPA